MVPKPFFMTNKDWFYFDAKECRYKLTDKATKEAKKSFDEFYADVKRNKEK